MAATFVAQEYEAIEPGVYAAQLVGIERIETPTSEFGKEANKWTFLVDLGDGTETPFSALTSLAAGSASKSYKWATALLGRPPAVGEEVNLEGLKCQLHIIVNEKGFNRIETVIPAAKPARRGQPVAAAVAETGEVPF